MQQEAVDRLPCRTTLPAPAPERSLNIWSFLKTCIGKELTKISMPVTFNEPLSLLQRLTENMEYASLLELAAARDDPVSRMLFVAAFQVAGNAAANGRYNKPFNPVLGETYELTRPELSYRWLTEQVSHHPPVSAYHGGNERWSFYGSTQPKLKFWGKSIEVKPIGVATVELKSPYNETYTWNPTNVLVHNIVVGKLWSEFCGTVEIVCHETGCKATLNYKPSSSPTSKDFGRFDGFIINKLGERKKCIFGKWTQYLCVSDCEEQEKLQHTGSGRSASKPGSGLSDIFSGSRASCSHNNKRASSAVGERSQSVTSDSQNTSTKAMLHSALTVDLPNIPAEALPSSNSSERTAPVVNESNTGCDWTKKAAAELTECAGAVTIDETDRIPGAVILWACRPRPVDSAKYYNMTQFAMGLNELPQIQQAAVLPRSDARFRADIRFLEEGLTEQAAAEKDRIEAKQRTQRHERKQGDDGWQPMWFELRRHPVLVNAEQSWMFKNTYWDRSYSSVPDIF